MKSSLTLTCLLLVCSTAFVAPAEEGVERLVKPKLDVTVPLLPIEKSAAARLTRVPTARLWWNDDNRAVGVSLKGRDASDHTLHLAAQLPGLRILIVVAFSTNQLTDQCLAPFATHQQLSHLSIAGGQLTDNALDPLQSVPTLETLILHSDFTDNALPVVAQLPRLRYLDLTQCQITDSGATYLAEMVNLETLILNGTDVSNAGVASLANLKKLTHLFLGDTAVDDGAIEQLKGFEQLELLFLKGTRISADGVAELTAALPLTCEIKHDSGTFRGERVPRTALAPTPATQWQAAHKN